MKLVSLFALGFVSATGYSHTAFAQRGELSVNYSLLVYNPAKSLAANRDLNGGGGSIGLNFGDYFSIKAEFQGYEATTLTFHLAESANSPAGTFSTEGNMFTYLFGPQLTIPLHRKRIFGEALFGGANTNAYANLFKAADVTGLSATNNGFAMAVGGGFDFAITKHMALRPVQLDYFLTRYEWKPLGINNQSNFRYQGGLVFLLGGS